MDIKLIDTIMKSVITDGNLPKHPERLSYMNDEYIKFIFENTKKPIMCIDNITGYFGTDLNTLNSTNRFHLDTFEIITKLFQDNFYLQYIKNIPSKEFITLEKKQFDRIFELDTVDLERFIGDGYKEMISTLRIIRDREFNIAISRMKYNSDDPDTF